MIEHKVNNLLQLIDALSDINFLQKREVCTLYLSLGYDYAITAIYIINLCQEPVEKNCIERVEEIRYHLESIKEKAFEYDVCYPLRPSDSGRINFCDTLIFKDTTEYLNDFYINYRNPKKKLHLKVYKGGK